MKPPEPACTGGVPSTMVAAVGHVKYSRYLCVWLISAGIALEGFRRLQRHSGVCAIHSTARKGRLVSDHALLVNSG